MSIEKPLHLKSRQCHREKKHRFHFFSVFRQIKHTDRGIHIATNSPAHQSRQLGIFPSQLKEPPLTEDRAHHLTVNICQPIAAALELVGEPLVVDPQQMQ